MNVIRSRSRISSMKGLVCPLNTIARARPASASISDIENGGAGTRAAMKWLRAQAGAIIPGRGQHAAAEERRKLTAGRIFRFSPPQHLVRVVRRPTLLDRLDEGLRCRCTIVEAPAGY